MLLLSSILPVLTLARHVSAASSDTFGESLALHPLPDGKLSVLFEFTTHFTGSSKAASSHHSLTPPALLLPLEHNNVSELTISFVAGQWDQRRSGEAGPLHYEAGGGGGEVRGWLKGDPNSAGDRWTHVTHALGGLFCAGLGPSEHATSVDTFGDIYPPLRGDSNDLTHHLLPHANLLLCTENLTPFLSLLPSKGLSGLSSLLAQPSTVFAWGFKTEGIEVIMPTATEAGRWRGWWEGVVDLVPVQGACTREFSIDKLFSKALPQPFPEADHSILRLIMPDSRLEVDRIPTTTEGRWIDGRKREIREWDLQGRELVGQDIKFWWDNEGNFQHPKTLPQPPVTVARTVTSPHAGDGVFTITIANAGNETRSAVYSEVWPWWVKGWLHEISVSQNGTFQPELLEDLFYKPSAPPALSATTLHLSLSLPPRSLIEVKIPFTKLMLKYTEHRPDAERGVEIPSGTLTLLDLLGEDEIGVADESESDASVNPRRSGRNRIYTTRLLLDVPTPDFSMPYNVIIMSSTVMAVFFGLMQGTLTRRWTFVKVAPETGTGQVTK